MTTKPLPIDSMTTNSILYTHTLPKINLLLPYINTTKCHPHNGEYQGYRILGFDNMQSAR
jgi:hypothetical protein